MTASGSQADRAQMDRFQCLQSQPNLRHRGRIEAERLWTSIPRTACFLEDRPGNKGITHDRFAPQLLHIPRGDPALRGFEDRCTDHGKYRGVSAFTLPASSTAKAEPAAAVRRQ